MTILIDGYNLLKQLRSNEQITDRERTWFYERSIEYARRKGHKIVIIYDGGSYPRPTKEKTGTVTVVHSGYKDSADDVIKQYLDDKIFKNVLLVTTDRQLNAFADRYDIPSIDSLDFYRIMMQKDPQVSGYKKVPGTAQKLRPDEPPSELDTLMQKGSEFLQYKVEVTKEPDIRSSKKERRLLALLKKL